MQLRYWYDQFGWTRDDDDDDDSDNENDEQSVMMMSLCFPDQYKML